MRHVLPSLLVLVPVAALAAAPAPPPSEKELIAKYWGRTEGEGKFELASKQLTLRTAGPPAYGFFVGTRMNMPRATRTLHGDFEVTVKVADASPPEPKNQHQNVMFATRAGLTISGNGHCIELQLFQYYQNLNGAVQGDLQRYVWLDTWSPGGGGGGSLAQVPAGKSTYLRATRKDKAVTVAHSFDGKEWSAPAAPRQGLDLPDEVTAGVFLAHSTHQSAAATFDLLTVGKPK